MSYSLLINYTCATEYQFVYVDKKGEVCARSRPFTFCAPKPLEELETLKEEQDEEDGEEELLLVIPRAQLLQSRLEECLKEQAELQQALDVAKKEAEKEKEKSKKAKMEWEREREVMQEEISELRENVKLQCEMLKKIKGKHEMENEASLAEVHGLQERLEASEHVAECLRRELRELGTRQGHTHTELHQARLQVAQLTLQLSEENLVLREERANWALEREAYKHAAETEKKKLQDLSGEVQRKEQWLREERMEREKLEVELGRERDCNKVLLSDAKRELQELKASVRKSEREREEQQLDKQIYGFETGHSQNMLKYIRHLEQKFGVGPETKSNGDVPTSISPDSSSEVNKDTSSRSICSPLFLEPPNGAEIPAETHIQSEEDTSASDTQDEKRQDCEPRAGEGKQLILEELVNPVLR
eukprot:superscaffoldBa00000723_g6794